MPTGIYIRTPEIIRKSALAHIGIKHKKHKPSNTGRNYKGVCFNTGKTHFKKDDMRLIGNKNAEGNIPWNKGKKGLITAWNKGKKLPQMSGPNNPAWKGGVSTENKIERTKFRKMMQKLIFERDDYTCQICGIRGVDLQVDHIQSWAEYVELRFNINNCRTLCKKCHYFITFGKEMVNKDMPWGHNLGRGIEL
jgi:hypothetical protein